MLGAVRYATRYMAHKVAPQSFSPRPNPTQIGATFYHRARQGAADTIFAVATGKDKSAIAIIRISGPRALQVLAPTCEGGMLSNPGGVVPRVAHLKKLRDPSTSDHLDNAVVLSFPSRGSFTGEDVVELHIHGGTAVKRALLTCLGKMEGFRMAERGEFTKRAFQHQKLDLTEAEGLADLLNADTELQRRQALRQLDGSLSSLYLSWRAALMQALAHLEAHIDFGEDEDDCDSKILSPLKCNLTALKKSIAEHLADGRRGEIIRDGLVVSIVGPPNAGKSSLLNAVAKRPLAIVSNIPGTTRDVLEVHLDLAGLPVTLCDTAGIRDNSLDIIELEGMARARSRASASSFTICMLDCANWSHALSPSIRELLSCNTIVVFNKAESVSSSQRNAMREAFLRSGTLVKTDRIVFISCLTAEGVPDLIALLEREGNKLLDVDAPENIGLLTRERHRLHLTACIERLAIVEALSATSVDIVAEELRLAARCLSKITGQFDVEELLDIIFSDFCIGK
jgi:tRNA modification GTPase